MTRFQAYLEGRTKKPAGPSHENTLQVSDYPASYHSSRNFTSQKSSRSEKLYYMLPIPQESWTERQEGGEVMEEIYHEFCGDNDLKRKLTWRGQRFSTRLRDPWTIKNNRDHFAVKKPSDLSILKKPYGSPGVHSVSRSTNSGIMPHDELLYRRRIWSAS